MFGDEPELSGDLAEARADILDRLRSAGFDAVCIHYNGEGDSGQIEDIWRLDVMHARVEPLRKSGEIMNDHGELVEALDAYAWKVLAAYHEGFETDGGGYGYMTIDVADDQALLVHTERNTSYEEV